MVRSLTLAALLGAVCTPVFAQQADTIPSVQPSVTNGELINDLHQREWVRLNADGTVAGKLFVLAEDGSREKRVAAKVVVSRDGKSILETKSDENGNFELSGLTPGTYALQVRGDVTFAAYALHILPNESEHLSTDLEVFAAVIPSKRALELVNANLMPSFAAAEDVYYRDHQTDPLKAERKFNDSHRIRLQNGSLVGRVSRPGWTFGEQDLTGSVAQIVRDGKVIAKAGINTEGFFTVNDLQPGVYDLFVSGDDGFAALAFEAVAENALAGSPQGTKFVSQVAPVADCLCCELVQQPEITCCEVVETVAVVDSCETCNEDPCGCGASPLAGGGMVGGGGFYGGGGGGGAGYGGMGGGGALLGAAGLALGIAALSDDDDGFNQNVATVIVAP